MNWSKVCTKCPLCKIEYGKVFKVRYGERIDMNVVKKKDMIEEDEPADDVPIVIEGSNELVNISRRNMLCV